MDKKYRKLRSNEIVRENDEVLNEFTQKIWTKFHGYKNKKVNECKGGITGNQREFRRIKCLNS